MTRFILSTVFLISAMTAMAQPELASPFAPRHSSKLDGTRLVVDSVYVSTSPYAYAYHKTLKCEGLQRTTRKIIRIPKPEAERKRKPCRYCYKREFISVGGEIKGDSIVTGD